MNKLMKYIFAACICTLPNIVFAQSAATPNPSNAEKLKACIAKVDKDAASASQAYADGLIWRLHYGGMEAEQCIALALIGTGEYEIGARRLFSIANAPDGGTDANKTNLLIKSANAFLLAELPDEALKSLDLALTLKPNDGDLLIDRARAHAMLEHWDLAEADLTGAMTQRGPLGFAYRLRAETRLQQKKYDLAENDINDALRLEPKEVQNYVVRGRVREARRLGHAPD